MIKIKIEKKNEEDYIYISKDDFRKINDNSVTLKYIRLMRKIKHVNKKEFINNIYKILIEISIENVDTSNIKIFVNNYYKHVKVYKKHMKSLSGNRECNQYIIDFYANVLENINSNIDSMRYILHLLYNEKILCDKYILEWYHNLDKNSKFINSTILKDFMEWLEDQSSESDVSENKVEVDSD